MKLLIEPQFNGPAGSGQGGVTCGLLAQMLSPDSAVEVTLRLPPPLGRPLPVVETPDGELRLLDDSALVAEARLHDGDLDPVDPVDFSVAAEASAHYDGWTEHPFPTCFVCGTERHDQDGYGIYPGAVNPEDRSYLAAPWTAGDEPGAVDVWAVLDCPGGWSIDLTGRRAVLGRMAVRIDALPAPGEHCVVVAQCDGWDGRKAYSRTSLYGGRGALLATSGQVWIETR